MTNDIMKEMGYLFLGSRLKRLAERMQGDVASIAERAGLAIQPSQYPILIALDRFETLTVGVLAEKLGLSQPAITRNITRLVELGLIETIAMSGDQRRRSLSLTSAGRDAMVRSKREVWPHIDAAVVELCAGLNGPLLEQIAAIEDALDHNSIEQRALAGPVSGLTIREFSDELARDFHDINAEWIASMFRIEQTDRDVLENPRARIMDPGGVILFAEARDLGIIGACALQKTGERRFELTKMGVLESARGRKAGEYLLAAILRRARQMEVETLYLLTSSKCAAAIHLYEKLGFAHDAEIMRDFGARYERCDVAMRYRG
ncbi:bifunctional helix-turn-helix transcriptional regulator/GNAT family N-acetyltransferase [Sphingomonas alpina]|uniref:MarR family transcriptional regulator/GNAT family N-acetyltransferase n=1 Tax=Sphingomonas alpina TaxID=653931 RepID=A0A7H0LK79_9SPHN|nr:bifunctional helix-turn-helix transcriptional regulator/GNAT family N-acetyltransferase [Sphingomonas alpina]QNQ10082.1 MarR family transcriptional regulator/GNAT family N-acetyltransferase [Sphingomonas alpina]